THGVEMWGRWQAAENLRFTGGLVAQDVDVRVKPGSTDLLGGNDPNYYGQLRASYDITPRHELDVSLRRVGELPQPHVDAYTAMDVRLGWKISRDLELALVGQNLIGHGRTEFNSQLDEKLFDRRLFAKLTWRFQ
ncbi:MAG TPA: hypothetical protein VFX01_07795, partial [Methylophilaceae bacterium]|nr:hypothetical protein [Methylophilaceae bacterium]